MTKLIQTRPEKSTAMSVVVGEMRNAIAHSAREHELNLAEAINISAHIFTSLLVGGYDSHKDREAVIQALPDLVRAYVPQWERIYGRKAPSQ